MSDPRAQTTRERRSKRNALLHAGDSRTIEGQHMVGLRILVVEDDVDSGEALAFLLEDLGHQVKLVFSPAQAIAVCAELRPQLAILDVGLPGMSGFELVAALRAMPQLKGCRYLAWSAFSDRSYIETATAAGFERYLSKPLVYSELEASLGRRPVAQSLSSSLEQATAD